MKIQTMSIVVGTTACNARCPFCISKTTPNMGFCSHSSRPTVKWRNFKIACEIAEKAGVNTVLLTGKGEPTLYPEQITSYLRTMNDLKVFPIRELQTNGMKFSDPQKFDYDNAFSLSSPYKYGFLEEWYNLGLTTICLSAAHTETSHNRQIYGEDYCDIEKLASVLNEIGYTIRLSVMMLKDYIDTTKKVVETINFCRENKIKQLTIRPIAYPERGNRNSSVYNWIMDHTLDEMTWETIKAYIASNADPVLQLAHGATVYDYEGQNICLSTCITTNNDTENMRQIIFFPDGTIGYDWKYSGAVLL